MFVSLFDMTALFAWNPDGHCMTTGVALTAALATLNVYGTLARLGVSRWFMQKMMAWMPLDNCCEDVDWGNFSDKIPGDPFGKASDAVLAQFGHGGSPLVNYMAHDCAVALKGDQIKHFMVSLDEGATGAYFTSMRHIKESCREAWRHFNEAFPHPGLLAQAQGFWMELQETNLHDVMGGSLVEGFIDAQGSTTGGAILGVAAAQVLSGNRQSEFQQGQHHLGAALHTLQDSFSPAHTFRNPTNRRLVEDVYAYDGDNQGENSPVCSTNVFRSGQSGWPGHKVYDKWFWDGQTRSLRQDAEQASFDFIVCVLDNVHNKEGVFLGDLESKLFKWAANHITAK